MGIDHGGQRGQVPPPRIWSGDANTNCLPRFCHIGTKMSVCGLQNTPTSVFGHPSPYATPLDTDPHSALAMRPPRSPARSTPMDGFKGHRNVRLAEGYRSMVCLRMIKMSGRGTSCIEQDAQTYRTPYNSSYATLIWVVDVGYTRP